MKKLIFLCSPYSSDKENNIILAKEYAKYIINFHAIPIIPHLYFTQFMDDNNEMAKEMGFELMEYCDELWVLGETISEGMKKEIEFWNNNIKKRIRFIGKDEN